ncbi:hypothetical protein IFM89_030860 [Coptis chinensis]|uniref:Aspartate/ornithine carbamoyltransferase carbamoyl-P binding domain-containing protein n=1 Tax=Coptis chinensis TaxID=261450 RepID=A0A835H1X6_9MAGN|nr:hypothetical protein IFM89_030860 [Coptis chinensis]
MNQFVGFSGDLDIIKSFVEMALSYSISNSTLCSRGGLTLPKLGRCSQVSMSSFSTLTSEKLLLSRTRCHALETEKVLNTDKAFSFSAGDKFQLQDILDAQQFDRDILNAIFKVARQMEDIEKNSPGSQILKGYLMATLFYEPSTRTRLSFESAMKRLGGEVLTTENAREFSSAAKGETLEDTIRTVEGYSDIIVIRHFESGAARRAAVTAGIPVINAGDGPGQHPSQVNRILNLLEYVDIVHACARRHCPDKLCSGFIVNHPVLANGVEIIDGAFNESASETVVEQAVLLVVEERVIVVTIGALNESASETAVEQAVQLVVEEWAVVEITNGALTDEVDTVNAVEQAAAQVLEDGANGVVETTDGTLIEAAMNTAAESLLEQAAALVMEESVSQYGVDNYVDQDIEVVSMGAILSDSNVELEAEVNFTKN